MNSIIARIDKKPEEGGEYRDGAKMMNPNWKETTGLKRTYKINKKKL